MTISRRASVGGGGGEGNGPFIDGSGGAGGAGGNSFGDVSLTNVTFASSGFSASTAGQITITALSSSATTVTANPPTSGAGSSVRFVAFVSPSDGGGTVTFTSDGTPIPGCSALPLTTGGGTDWATDCTTSSLPVGTHTITATYSGDGAYAGSAGSTTEQVYQNATSTSISASQTSVGVNTGVNFTASVYSSDGGGTVTFTSNNVDLPGCINVVMTANGGAYQAQCGASWSQPGTYTIVAAYSGDANSSSSSANTTVHVYPALAVTTTSLPSGTVGQAYSATLAASGGSGNYSWSVASGSLPDGLALSTSGAITGTPTRNQTASFTAQVTDTTSGQTATANLSITVGGGSSAPLIIQGVRLAGPGGPADDYVELYNPTSGPVNLSGWQLGYSGGAVSLPAASLPAGGHYLIAGASYSLGAYENPDFAPAGLDLPSDGGVQLIAPNATVTDAVGMTTAAPAYREGAGLVTPSQTGAQLAYQRRMSAGVPVTDKTDNAADFVLVATDANTTDHGAGAVLGAPAPQNLTWRIDANDVAQSYLLNPSEPASGADNRTYNASTGTLTVRRTITNTSNTQTITALWVRYTSITTYGDTTANQALLTAQTATGGETVDGKYITGTTVDQPPNQPNGGGLGTSLLIDVGDGGLAPGQSINVDLQFHVARGGSFSFGYNAEIYTGH